MKEFQDIKRLLYPIVKGLPFILFVFSFSVILTWRLTKYQLPVYEAKAVIKLDDHSEGFSDNNLYQDLDIFSETNDVLTEVEMLRSDAIMLRALNLMPTCIEYFRVGDMKTSEIYQELPFEVFYDTITFLNYDELYDIQVIDDKKFKIAQGGDSLLAYFNKPFTYKQEQFTIQLSSEWLKLHPMSDFVDLYQFRINTNDNLLRNFVKEHLFVKEIDKNIRIITVHFEGENPQRVADYTNAVAQAYLDDHIATKMAAADLTENFLVERIKETEKELLRSESALEDFRLENRVLNVRQETETDLRKISQLQIQVTNLKMKKVVLDSLSKYVFIDRYRFMQLAPSYEAYGGLLFTELIKKLKSLESDRIDLSNRFAESSQEIRTIDKKIENVIDYVVENIENHKKNTNYQLDNIEQDIKLAERKLDGLPTLEKKMLRLERDFQHYHDLYNFLKKKRMEAGIAKRAKLFFHRVIKKATPAPKPSRPNKSFNIALAGFLSLLLSVAFVYIRVGAKGAINSRFQLENLTEAPILGVVKDKAHVQQDGSIDFMIANLLPIIKQKESVKIAFSSSVIKEGKTFLVNHTAKALAASGRKVLIVDINVQNSEWQKLVAPEIETKACLEDFFLKDNGLEEVLYRATDNLDVCGFSRDCKVSHVYLSQKFDQKLEQLAENYDVVLFDCPAYSIASESPVFMRYSDFKVFIVRYDFTNVKFISNIENLVKKYGTDQVGVVLNAAPAGMNYSGRFFGSRFQYNPPKGFFATIVHYWKSYGKSWNI